MLLRAGSQCFICQQIDRESGKSMELRQKSYAYYNISPERFKFLKKYCREDLTGEKLELLHKVCQISNESISKQLFLSMAKGLSWERQYQMEPIPLGLKDFYAYRRKAYSLLNEQLLAGKGK